MADRYWVGGTGNWSDNTNHWSASTGGAPNASKPTSDDNVYFDASSFTGAGQVVTVDDTAYYKDMDWTGATNNPTFTIPLAVLACYGTSIIFSSDMTINQTAYGWYLNLYGSDTVSITTNGNSINRATVNIQNTKTLSLTEDLSCRTLQVPTGSLITNNYNITASENTVGFYIYGTNAKTVTLGSSTITTAIWRVEGSNLTLNEGTSTINCSGNFIGNGETYNIVNLTGATSTVTGSNTFATLALPASTTQTITLTAGTKQTCTTATLSGDATHQHTIVSGTAGKLAYISAGTVTQDYVTLTDVLINSYGRRRGGGFKGFRFG